jgi:hypothetical protein
MAGVRACGWWRRGPGSAGIGAGEVAGGGSGEDIVRGVGAETGTGVGGDDSEDEDEGDWG